MESDRLNQAARAMADLAARWSRRLATIRRLAEPLTFRSKEDDCEGWFSKSRRDGGRR